MTQRISGDTLASSDSVAMIPTVHPAAAGTHQKAERCLVFAGLLAAARVIGREDIRSTGEMGGTAGDRVSPNGSGEPFARTLARLLGEGAGLLERQLQALEPVPDGSGVQSEVFDGP